MVFLFRRLTIVKQKVIIIFFVCLVDRSRVTLWPYTGLVGSDYINASFVDVSRQPYLILPPLYLPTLVVSLLSVSFLYNT